MESRGAMSSDLREALERLVTASHHVQPDPLSVRTMAEIPRERLIALWDAEHAARAALAAAQPAEGLDIPDYGDREPYTFAQAKHLLQKVEKAINKDYHHYDLHAEVVEWLARLLHEGGEGS